MRLGNILSLNVIIKKEELNVDLSKRRTKAHPHSHRRGCSGSGSRDSSSLRICHGPHTPIQVTRSRQRPFPPQEAEKIWHGPSKFYSCTIESTMTGFITAWYGNCLASDRKALQRVVRMAQYITVAKLPAIQDLDTRRYQRKALTSVRLQLPKS